MEEDRKKLTEKKLLSCGKREFLEKGYAKANLRSICIDGDIGEVLAQL